MAETETHKPRRGRRIILAAFALMLLLILAVVALRVYVTTEPGARFFERQINSRSFGPITSVNISGLSGDPLKDFSVSRIEIKDKDGVWLNAQNMTLNWTPLALLRRELKIDQLEISQANAFRRPNLEKTAPSETNKPYRLSVPSIHISRLTLHEELVGLEADFEASAGAEMTDSETSVRLNAVRTDILGDSFEAAFKRNKDGNVDGTFDVSAVANGPIAKLIQAPNDEVITGSGTLKGNPKAGSGTFNLAFGTHEAAAGNVNWTAQMARLKTVIDMTRWDSLHTARERIGNTIEFTGSINRIDTKGLSEAPFMVELKAPKLTAEAEGIFPKKGLIPAGSTFVLNSENLSDLAILPEGYQAGKTTLDGSFTNISQLSFTGQINLKSLITPYGKVAHLSGPLSVSKTGESTYNYSGELDVSNLSMPQELPIAIGKNAKIISKGKFDLNSRQITFGATQLSSGASNLSAQGNASWAPLSYDVTGDMAVAVLAQGSIPSGELMMDFNVTQTKASAAALSADGRFKPEDPLAAPISSVIGEDLTFRTRMSPLDGGVKISEAQISGDNIRAAIEGRITDSYDLSGEAILTSSLPISNLTLGDKTNVSFNLSGPRVDPNFRLDATSSKVSISEQTLASPRLRVEIQDILNAPKGPLQFEADTEYGAFVLTSQFASKPGIYAVEDISLRLGEFTANGDLNIAESKLATGQFDMNLPQDGDRFARASLKFAPNGTEQGLSLSVDAKNIALEQYEFDFVNAQAEGTLKSLVGQFETKGRRNISLLSRGFELNTPFKLNRNEGKFFDLQFSPKGKYGDIELGVAEPVSLKYGPGLVTLNAPLTISGQPVTLDYSKVGLFETFTLGADTLPINLVPMPGNLADTRGRAGINLKLQSAGSGVTGGGNIELKDWRGFDVKPENGINATTTFTLDGTRGDIKLDGQSISGFTVSGNSQFGLNNAPTITALRLDNTAPISGEFNMSGAASSVLGLVTPSDAELGGELTARLRLSGTAKAPLVDGSASGQDIRFEAPELGTRIRKGRFTTTFQNDRLSVTDLYFQDSRQGTLTGKGEFTLGELGRPLGSLEINAKKFQALDRRDLESVVSGKLSYQSRQEEAELIGEIKLNEAEVKEFITGEQSVIEIEVDEINRPDTVQAVKFQDNPLPVNLNVKVKAPREIYVRSRGLDVELSVDMDITGAIDAPLFNGKAEVVRGGYKLAGKTLQFTDGEIKFDGALPDAKLSLLAETQTTDITAKVEISGTVEKPSIELTSIPERPQDEILSVLLFGRSATELSSIEAAQLAGALAQFSGSGVGFDLFSGLRDAFGIGQLSIGFAEDGTAQISGGRYLARNVYLQVFSGAGQDQTGAIIEWEIRKNLSLRSRLQADNDQTFSLKYKKDF